MAMYFKCKVCGSEHRSQIQMPRATFESPTTQIRRSLATCPTTGQETTCDKEEITWRENAYASA